MDLLSPFLSAVGCVSLTRKWDAGGDSLKWESMPSQGLFTCRPTSAACWSLEVDAVAHWSVNTQLQNGVKIVQKGIHCSTFYNHKAPAIKEANLKQTAGKLKMAKE